MKTGHQVATDSFHSHFSPEEWQDRLNAAALFRLAALHRMSDAANQVIAVRSSEDSSHYITSRVGDFFEDVCASKLIRVTSDNYDFHTGRKLRHGVPGELNGGTQNIVVAAFEARPEMNAFIHVHAKPIFTVSTLDCGLLALSQPSLYIIPKLGYWPYVFVEDETFQPRFRTALASKEILLAKNHGGYVIGRTPAEAFFFTFYLAQACDIQLSAMSTGATLHPFTENEVRVHWDEMMSSSEFHFDGSLEWAGWMRSVERYSPDYKL